MKLPNLHLAEVPRRKMVDYLLSTTHRRGRDKPDFFVRFGFSSNSWEQLADALKLHAAEHDFISQEPTPLGTRYVVEGTLNCPDGRDL
jgi:hypothetical protein